MAIKDVHNGGRCEDKPLDKRLPRKLTDSILINEDVNVTNISDTNVGEYEEIGDEDTGVEERRNGFARSKSCPSYSKEDKEVMAITSGSGLNGHTAGQSRSEAMLLSCQISDATQTVDHRQLDSRHQLQRQCPSQSPCKTTVRNVAGAQGPQTAKQTQGDIRPRLNKVSSVRDRV